jgi:hypothetical protein
MQKMVYLLLSQMFRASSCPSSGEWYKIDSAYGVQHLCPSATQPVLYTIGGVDFVPFS